MKTILRYRCPYCNVKLHRYIEASWDATLTYCESDEAESCGKPFVLEWRFEPMVKLHKVEPCEEWSSIERNL